MGLPGMGTVIGPFSVGTVRKAELLVLSLNPRNLEPPNASVIPDLQLRNSKPSPEHLCQERGDEGGGAERKVRRIASLGL